VRRRFSTIIAWPRMAGIADFRLLPLGGTDEHWKELPHHFFNRQSAIKTFIFNNIPASLAHPLCFHIHSRFTQSFPQRSFVFNNIPASLCQKKNSFSRKQTSCPVEKEDSSAAFISPGLRSRTDLRRRIEKSVRQCPRVPPGRTLTMLAYLALPVKRQNAALRVQESGASRTYLGQAPASAPNCRFSIYPAEAGLIDRGGSCPSTSSIDNLPAAAGQ